MRTTCPRSWMKILPSPIWPVRAALDFGVSALAAVAFDLGHGQPGDADVAERFAHVIELERFDNGNHELHGSGLAGLAVPKGMIRGFDNKINHDANGSDFTVASAARVAAPPGRPTPRACRRARRSGRARNRGPRRDSGYPAHRAASRRRGTAGGTRAHDRGS